MLRMESEKLVAARETGNAGRWATGQEANTSLISWGPARSSGLEFFVERTVSISLDSSSDLLEGLQEATRGCHPPGSGTGRS